MCNLYRLTKCSLVFVAVLLGTAGSADFPDISARRLLSAWKDQDANMRMVAEVIASAFSSGLSWRGSLGGKEVYCPPPGLRGGQVMNALERFLKKSRNGGKDLRRRYGGLTQPCVSLRSPMKTNGDIILNTTSPISMTAP